MVDWKTVQFNLLEMLLADDSAGVFDLARQTLAQGVSPADLFAEGITPALYEIGRRFETLDVFLPEMVIAAEIVQSLNQEVIQPQIEATQSDKVPSQGRVLLATIQGDLHDIGKNMVALMLRVNGFDVIDLGINVSPYTVVDRAIEAQADIIGLSSLLTTCLPFMKDTVDILQAKGVRDQFPIIIGGAAPTPEFAARIGVDAQGHSAAEAVRICKSIMETRRVNKPVL